MTATRELIATKITRELPASARDWIDRTRAEIARGVEAQRFSALLSLASRYVPRKPWTWAADEIAQAHELCAGWNPERWSPLETARVSLVLSRSDLERESGATAVEEAFRYADVGELCALYRSLAHLPEPRRFAWRAGEGCRTSMRAVFEAVACDTPYPVRYFDDVAWRQLAIKCLFVEAPLWRVFGLDARLDPELARMALDLADERRSAGRTVPYELWLCLGSHCGERGIAALERELAGAWLPGRRAAAIALARAGAVARLSGLARKERDPTVLDTMRAALAGRHDQREFAHIDAA